MGEKFLLLSSTTHHSAATPSLFVRVLRVVAIGVGILCVIFGAADLFSRVSKGTLNAPSANVAFAPAVTLYPSATSSPEIVVPARLSIPSLGIQAAIEAVGLQPDGAMATPKDFDNVGWYSYGAKPGEPGSALFAGHVNNALLKSGVFANLSKIAVGEYVVVEDTAGKKKMYKVFSVEEYPADASTETIFSTSGPSQLVLITCDGAWVPAQKTFDRRLVVIAKPV